MNPKTRNDLIKILAPTVLAVVAYLLQVDPLDLVPQGTCPPAAEVQ